MIDLEEYLRLAPGSPMAETVQSTLAEARQAAATTSTTNGNAVAATTTLP